MSSPKILNSELQQYDVCIITMSEVKYDARSLNIIRTLVKNNRKVCVIGFGMQTDYLKFKNEGFHFYFINSFEFARAFQTWRYFNRNCRNLLDKIKSKIYWASDFFSLKPAKDFAEKYSSSLFYDSREIYSSIGSLHNRKLTQNLQTYLEKRWVRKVDKIIVTGELDKEYLKKHFKHNIPYYIIKNFPAFKEPVRTNLLREKFNIPVNKKILIYQGLLSEGRGIIPIIKSMQLLEDYVFCLLGDGVLRKEAMNLATELDIASRVFFAGNIDYDELHNWTCSADIGMSIIEPVSLSYKLALPNKLFEYCMAGIPCITSNLPAMKKVIEEYGIGEIVNHINPEEIAQTIMKVSDIDNYDKYRNACIRASKNLSFDSQEELVMSVFN